MEEMKMTKQQMNLQQNDNDKQFLLLASDSLPFRNSYEFITVSHIYGQQHCLDLFLASQQYKLQNVR